MKKLIIFSTFFLASCSDSFTHSYRFYDLVFVHEGFLSGCLGYAEGESKDEVWVSLVCEKDELISERVQKLLPKTQVMCAQTSCGVRTSTPSTALKDTK